MTATREDIERWLRSAKEKEATHLIIAVDTHNYENYPVYVSPEEKIDKEIKRVISQALQGIDEVYNMSKDIDEQLSEQRAWNM